MLPHLFTTVIYCCPEMRTAGVLGKMVLSGAFHCRRALTIGVKRQVVWITGLFALLVYPGKSHVMLFSFVA